MANIKIRQYTSSDLEPCRALWAEMTQYHRDIYNDPSIGGDNPGLEFDKHLEKVGPERIWVSLFNEEIAGLVSLVPDMDNQQAEVEPLVVSAKHRGKGIGKRLLTFAVEEAKKWGVLCLGVKPVARNEKAVSFFYESGFKTLGHVHQFMWLGPSVPGAWKPGPDLFGKAFDY